MGGDSIQWKIAGTIRFRNGKSQGMGQFTLMAYIDEDVLLMTHGCKLLQDALEHSHEVVYINGKSWAWDNLSGRANAPSLNQTPILQEVIEFNGKSWGWDNLPVRASCPSSGVKNVMINTCKHHLKPGIKIQRWDHKGECPISESNPLTKIKNKPCDKHHGSGYCLKERGVWCFCCAISLVWLAMWDTICGSNLSFHLCRVRVQYKKTVDIINGSICIAIAYYKCF